MAFGHSGAAAIQPNDIKLTRNGRWMDARTSIDFSCSAKETRAPPREEDGSHKTHGGRFSYRRPGNPPKSRSELRWAHGFASPPYDEFAFIQDETSLTNHHTAAPEKRILGSAGILQPS
jgi:hypothetical protein